MSTFRTPVGPQPSKTYWRRRLVVGLGIIAVIVIVILIVVRPGSNKPVSAPHTPPSSTAPVVKTGKVTACNPANVSVTAVTDATTYAANVNPQLSLTVTNNGSTRAPQGRHRRSGLHDHERPPRRSGRRRTARRMRRR